MHSFSIGHSTASKALKKPSQSQKLPNKIKVKILQ